MDSYCGTTTSKSSYIEITLRNLKGNHNTSISASKNMSTPVDKNDNRSHFIRLDESVNVDVSPRSVEETVQLETRNCIILTDKGIWEVKIRK